MVGLPARALRLGREQPTLPFPATDLKTEGPFSFTAFPLVKWAGGKGQLLAQLREFFPETFRSYFEPFIGGGAVFFYLRRERGRFPAVLMDANRELINCYSIVRDKVDKVIRELRNHQEQHSRRPKSYYYCLRDEVQPEALDKVQRAARLIYLNKTCYNGLYRVNRAGRFNVPIGSYKKPPILNEANLRAVAGALRGVELRTGDFSDVRNEAGRNDLAYFDPPYYLRRLGFTGYAVHQFGGLLGGADFGADEHDRLMRIARRLVERGCHVIISNSDTEYVRRLYADFQIHPVKARRYINSDSDGRSPVNEIVITDS